MLAGIQNAAAGLRASDFQMDVLGSRLSSDLAVPFPQVMDQASSPSFVPLALPGKDGERATLAAATGGSGSSQLPGLLPADTAADLSAGNLAGDMGLYLVAKATTK